MTKRFIGLALIVISAVAIHSILKRVLPSAPLKSPALFTPSVPPAPTSKGTPEIPVGPKPKPVPKSKGDVSPIDKFESLKQKVLPSPEEASERSQLLSDPKTIETVVSELMDTRSRLTEEDRLHRIDFLEGAITWEENPIRSDVLSKIESIISFDEFPKASSELKRQFIGDKVELFTILSQEEPSRAAELKSRLQSSKVRPVLDYAMSRLKLKVGREG